MSNIYVDYTTINNVKKTENEGEIYYKNSKKVNQFKL
jgi:hypothetical protein